MSNRAIIPEWWTEFSQVVLNNPKLTQVVIELAERDDGAMMAEALATDVTERRRAIDGKDGLGEDGRYEQSTLSTDLKNDLEPLGLVIRPAKAERPDQSIIYTVGWTIEYLAKQDLENGRPVDWSGDDQTAAMMEHTLDVTADEVPDVRHPVPLEGVLYTIADKHATVSGKEIHVEVGDPASFSDAAGTLAEKLYEADHEGQPLPKFPQHRDDTAWDDNYHDYAVVGEIHQVDEVPVFDDLKRDIESELKSWAAAAIELYVRENSEELPYRLRPLLPTRRSDWDGRSGQRDTGMTINPPLTRGGSTPSGVADLRPNQDRRPIATQPNPYGLPTPTLPE